MAIYFPTILLSAHHFGAQNYFKLIEKCFGRDCMGYGLTTLAEFIYPEIAQEQFLGKKILLV